MFLRTKITVSSILFLSITWAKKCLNISQLLCNSHYDIWCFPKGYLFKSVRSHLNPVLSVVAFVHSSHWKQATSFFYWHVMLTQPFLSVILFSCINSAKWFRSISLETWTQIKTICKASNFDRRTQCTKSQHRSVSICLTGQGVYKCYIITVPKNEDKWFRVSQMLCFGLSWV